MLEIFTTSPGSDGSVQRTESAEISLSGPQDVYFGPQTAGIAFYQKAGVDLLVTLLDGSTVRIGNFFVTSPEGTFSRLLLGPGGAVEVTALIAPEPLQPDLSVAEAAPQPEATPQPALQPRPSPVVDTPAAAEFTAATEAAPAVEATQAPAPLGEAQVLTPAGGGAGGGGFFDFAADQVIQVGLLSVPLLTVAITDSDGGSEAPPAGSPAARSDAAVSAEEVAALLATLDQGDGAPRDQMNGFDQTGSASDTQSAEAVLMGDSASPFAFDDTALAGADV